MKWRDSSFTLVCVFDSCFLPHSLPPPWTPVSLPSIIHPNTPAPGQQWQLPSLSSASEVQEPNRESSWKGTQDPWNPIHDGEGLRWLWCPPCCDDGLYVIGTDRICLWLQICRRLGISLGAWIDRSWREVLMGYRVSKHFLRLMVSVCHLAQVVSEGSRVIVVSLQRLSCSSHGTSLKKKNTWNNVDKWMWCANRPKALQYMKDAYSV